MATNFYRGLMLVGIALALLFGEAKAAAPGEPEIEKLVRDLGSKDFRVRQDAKRRLTELEAVPALRKASNSDDPEIARLAQSILRDLEKSAAARSLEKLRQQIADGKADLVIDRFARWNGPEDDQTNWELLIDFAWDVAKRAKKKHALLNDEQLLQSSPVKSTKEFDFVKSGRESLFIHSRQRFTFPTDIGVFVRADGMDGERIMPRQVLVSSNGIAVRSGIRRTIILATGGPCHVMHIWDAILICDGDIECAESIGNSVVIANGSVKCGDARNSMIVATGSITSRQKKDPTVTRLENEPNPFGFIKWFTVAEVGVEVAAAKDAVRIEKLHDGKLPLKAGLKVGDIVTAVDGTKVDSLASFRRRLLRGVVNEYCTLTVQRGGKSLDVPLDFRAEERAKEKAKQAEKK